MFCRNRGKLRGLRIFILPVASDHEKVYRKVVSLEKAILSTLNMAVPKLKCFSDYIHIVIGPTYEKLCHEFALLIHLARELSVMDKFNYYYYCYLHTVV